MEAESKRQGYDPRRRAMAVSLLVALLMLAGKLAAFFVTSSTAILSDAAESVVHLFATAFAAFSLWYADEPADTEHPYGHGKIAYLASGFEGGMILLAALGILYAAGTALLRGPVLRELGVGLLIIAGLCLINFLLGRYLIRTGRRHNSVVLVSNGQHVMTDMWTSLGVLAGVSFVWLTDLAWLDPVVAVLVAFNILWAAWRLLRRSVSGLMEKPDPQATVSILRVLEQARRERRIVNFHQVRHRRVNDQVWVEYHLLFPEGLNVTEAHDRSHAVEEAVVALFPDDRVNVTAHLEPAEHEAAHPEGHVEPEDPLSKVE